MPLVSVLWTLGLLSVIAASLLTAGATSYRIAHTIAQSAVADGLFEAAVGRSVLGLLTPQLSGRWRADGVPHDFLFNGTSIQVRIHDELGRIDINHADGPLLAALLQSVGLDATSADRLVDKILDWRDPQPLKRLNGAKDRDYEEAGRPYHPRNGSFQSVDEIKLVMDMTPEVFRRIEPALTVYSGRQFIDPQVAPLEALLALRALGQNVDTLIAAQQAPLPTYANNGPPDMLDPMTTLRGRAFAIRAQIKTDNPKRTYDAVIRITGNPRQPYWLLSWNAR
jgi:general secretion pathway protein K